MTIGEIIGLSVTLLVMMLAFVATIVPGVPGPPLVLIVAIVHRLLFGQHSVSSQILIVITVLALGSVVLDILASSYGAKRFGATWRGILGALVGGLVGIFFGLPGIIIGPFLGAMLFELMGGYKIDKASRAGLGATLGLFAGIIGKCIICVVMIVVFTVDVVIRS